MTFPGASLLALGMRAAVSTRNRLYDGGRLAVRTLPRPVISVGNLTLGGTGKTPFVESLARLVANEGYLVCILSRGYGSVRRDREPLIVSDLTRIRELPARAGDEPFLLARRLPGVPVVIGADRYQAGLFALERLPVHIFLLDDGFQHRRLRRDLDIVLLDSTSPWGGGSLLPAGRLREPRHALRRAHAIGLTRLHQCDATTARTLQAEVQEAAPGVPLFGTRQTTTGVRWLPRGPLMGLDRIAGRSVFAFAAIGRPEAFYKDVEAADARIVERRSFRDHHPYGSSDVRDLVAQAERCGAELLVTTEKDAVRLPALPRRGIQAVALRQEVVAEDPAALLRFVLSKLPQGGRDSSSPRR